ncbi:hypothetical protein [Algibacter mikhailovii]|uniref:hypothetical protein n=1 Tax=Algibacter mikhailovii TaxID=425498 RepID=UPI0024947180|nr:hypothetical protein [Algibacter mikhailovii]
MKNKQTIYLSTSMKYILFMICVLFSFSSTVAQKNTKTNIYVWDFKYSDTNIEEFADKLTDDFETELIKLDNYAVLQRRNHNLVLIHRDMENSISNVTNLSSEALDQLKTIQAEVVVFGELEKDEGSGVYEVTVFFQNLQSGKIPKKESVIIPLALINSNTHRKAYMKQLIEKLHAKEILKAKNDQFSFISKKLDTYLIKVKDVQIAYRDILDIALKNESYFKELEGTITSYNAIFNDLNDNGERYLIDFESVWGKTYGRDLENIYHDIMEDIHKKHILKLNDVRKKIWDYRSNQTSKNTRKQLKQEIMLDSKNSTLGLTADIDKTEDQIETLYNNLKTDMRTE